MLLFIIITLILLSSFFAGMEIVFKSSSRLKFELQKKNYGLSNFIITKYFENPKEIVSSFIIGYYISIVLLIVLSSTLVYEILNNSISNNYLIFLYTILILSGLVIITSYFIPKSLFNNNANYWLKFFSLPIYIFYIILFPITKLFGLFSDLFVLIFIRNKDKITISEVFNRIDIDEYLHSLIEEDSNNVADNNNELKMFQNALDFSNIKIRECIVPRTELEALDVNADIAELHNSFLNTGYSKILIYDGNIDNIIGYVHSKDLFKKPKSIKNIIRNLIIVPESMHANKLLSLFIKEKKNIAIVVDEFGGTKGIVTIEDMLEEILGEINDEHDTEFLEEKNVGNNEYIFSGRLEIDYLNEKYNLSIPESDEYETLAGYILSIHKSIPSVNDIIDNEKFIIKILKSSQTRIESCNMKIKSE